MSRWVQLLSIQYVSDKVCQPGDWVEVGSGVAEEWVRTGQARYGPKPSRAPARIGAGPPVSGQPSPRPEEDPLLARLKQRTEPDPNLKVAFGIIVFNGDFILEGVLSAVYPWAYQICVAEGPVKFWAETLGVKSSMDKTVEIIKSFPDPDKKISLVQGVWENKLQMCNAWIAKVKPDAHYVWEIDSDETYKQEDIKRILSLLGPDGYDSIAFQFRSFYGDLDRYMIGWEMSQPTHRIQRFYEGARWQSHRPPTILAPDGKPWRDKGKHVTHWELKAATGIVIWHYSFVWPSQTEMKYRYYKNLVKPGGVVEDGFRRIYLPWVQADEKGKWEIEQQFKGVHHLTRKPGGLHVCHTAKFAGKHPKWIEEHRAELEARIQRELKACLAKDRP